MKNRMNIEDLPIKYQEQVSKKLYPQKSEEFLGKLYEHIKDNIIISIEPMGKPRMTQRDKWKGRPVVKRYHAFKDRIRDIIPSIPKDTQWLNWTSYSTMPKSWSKKKKEEHKGQLRLSRPDRDNIDKAILDALFKEDSHVAAGLIIKRWDDGYGARIEFNFKKHEF